MAFDWYNRLPRWLQKVLDAIPSPVVEFASGLFTDALAIGIIWGLRAVGSWLTQAVEEPLENRYALVAAGFLAHGLSAFYEAFVDKRGWEWKDLLQREVGILAGLALAWYGLAR
jgi:hypothetical protein